MKSKILLTVLVLLASGCVSNKYSNFSVADGVMLAVSQQGDDRIRLKIRNDRTTPIFLGYYRGDGTTLATIGYSLVCFQDYKTTEETDFGPKDHSGMGLSPLEPSAELEFEVFPLPHLKRNCYISVGYYNNKKAIETVEKFRSNPHVRLTEEEFEFLEQSKQKVIVSVNIN